MPAAGGAGAVVSCCTRRRPPAGALDGRLRRRRARPGRAGPRVRRQARRAGPAAGLGRRRGAGLPGRATPPGGRRTRIGPVFTPPDTAGADTRPPPSQPRPRLPAAGSTAVVLFADPANPTSSGVYVSGSASARGGPGGLAPGILSRCRTPTIGEPPRVRPARLPQQRRHGQGGPRRSRRGARPVPAPRPGRGRDLARRRRRLRLQPAVDHRHRALATSRCLGTAGSPAVRAGVQRRDLQLPGTAGASWPASTAREFHTEGDGEAIVAAYHYWGAGCGRPAARDVRVPDLGHPGPGAVRRAGPVRHQAAVRRQDRRRGRSPRRPRGCAS